MKIAFVVDGFPRLSETFVLNQITGLLDRGHDVSIFTRRLGEESVVHPDVEKYGLLDRTYQLKVLGNKLLRVSSGIGLIATGLRKNPDVVLRTLDVLKYRKKALSLSLLHKAVPFLGYDIIHCQFGTNGNRVAILKELGLKGKLVTTFHGYDIRLGKAEGSSYYRKLFEVGDCFLAISDYNYDNLVRFGLDKRKIVRHPVGIEVARFPYRWRDGLAVNGGETPLRVITVARLAKEKGLTYAIKAIYRLLQQHPGLKLEYSIVGGGPLEADLTELIEELGLSEIVHLLNLRKQGQVIEMLGRSHVFLLSSVAEALPVVLMEAQAVGLPVVATAVGSTDQIVLDGRSGFLVPPRNVDALVDGLARLIGRPAEWPEFGRVGRRHVEENFDVDRLNDRLVDLYQRLLKGEQPQ